MSTCIVPQAKALSIGLGANQQSSVGSPSATLIAIRPLLEKIICAWIESCLKGNININDISKEMRWRWSPLFSTKPIGGPPNQPDFINAVLVADGIVMNKLKPSEEACLELLNKTLKLENDFGRDRRNTKLRWGPRTIDIDLLAWGELHIKNKNLILPHPRLLERSFVITPLAAALNNDQNSIPCQLPPQKGWNE